MKLKGRNCVGRHRKIAEELVSKIVKDSGVAGIVFAGGLARGFADEYSDIDVLVFLRRKSQVLRERILELSAAEQKSSGIDVDLEIHLLDDFRKRRLSEIHMWDLSHVQIVFDPDGKTEHLLREKTAVPRDFWIRRIVVYGEYLKWYCCPPRANIGTNAEGWVKRGDMVSAHYCVSYGLDMIVNVIYALNKEFLPPPKWRFFYLHNLEWLPNDFRRLLKQVLLVEALTVKNFDRRLTALRRLWQKTVPKVNEETGLTPVSMSKYFVEKVLHQV